GEELSPFQESAAGKRQIEIVWRADSAAGSEGAGVDDSGAERAAAEGNSGASGDGDAAQWAGRAYHRAIRKTADGAGIGQRADGDAERWEPHDAGVVGRRGVVQLIKRVDRRCRNGEAGRPGAGKSCRSGGYKFGDE